jgi:single-stranded DNA-binding protein
MPKFGFAKVIAIGEVIKESTIRYADPHKFNSFTICCKEYLPKVNKTISDYINVEIYGKEEAYKVGDYLYIEGSMSSSSYIDKEGQKKYKTIIKAGFIKRIKTQTAVEQQIDSDYDF